MSSYDRARRQQVDPNKVRWAGHKLNERAVSAYERNPNKRSTDGDPFIVRRADGSLEGWNGKHRGEAARRQGRKLTARVHDERTAGPAQAAGCMGLMLCAAVLVGLVGRRR
jgi:hypothetical protein